MTRFLVASFSLSLTLISGTGLSGCQADAEDSEAPVADAGGGGGGEPVGGGGGEPVGGGGGEPVGGGGGTAPACADRDRDPIVRGGALEFGECFGACSFELLVAEQDTTDGAVLCDVVELTVCEYAGGETCTVNAGVLTPAAHRAAREAAAALVGVPLEPQYACPGCADGAVRRVDLTRDGEETSHRYELDDRPEALAPADDLVQGLIEALRACTSSPLVEVGADCEPIE
jgi:hypothetical protein